MIALLALFRIVPAWCYALLLFVVLAGAGAVYEHETGITKGKAIVQEQWDAAEKQRADAEQKATLKAIENNTRIAQQQEIDNRKVSNAHQSELTAVRAEYERPAGRLRITSTVCDQFAGATKTDRTAGTDEAPAGTVVLPEPIERDLRRLARDADEVTATARALQEWTRKNGFAGD
jgi:hypothetical protein